MGAPDLYAVMRPSKMCQQNLLMHFADKHRHIQTQIESVSVCVFFCLGVCLCFCVFESVCVLLVCECEDFSPTFLLS